MEERSGSCVRLKALRTSKESFPRGRGSFLMQKSNKITFFLVKNLHIPNICCTFATAIELTAIAKY